MRTIVFCAISALLLTGCNSQALSAVAGAMTGLAEAAETKDCVNEGNSRSLCSAIAESKSATTKSSSSVSEGSYRLLTRKYRGNGLTDCEYGVRTVRINNFGQCPEYLK